MTILRKAAARHTQVLLVSGVLALLSAAVAAAETMAVAEPLLAAPRADGSEPPLPWQVINFDDDLPLTRYRVVSWDGLVAVESRAEASMALLARPLSIDLQRTPVLCWRWRVDAALNSANMATKDGDDYAARVYVAFRIPERNKSFGLRSKLRLARMVFGDQVPDAALSYVWDNQHPIGTTAPNAYTDRTRMLVLRSGNEQAGRWVSERRNVLADALAAFPDSDPEAASLAIGSDTDNTGESARAGFAELHFVAAEEDCRFRPLIELIDHRRGD